MVAIVIDTPHFKFPFSMTAGRVVCVEQDSEDEIEDCVEVLLSTVQGERMELPDYGIRDQAFQEGGIDAGHVQSQLRRYEERADVAIEPQRIEELTQHVLVNFRRNTNG